MSEATGTRIRRGPWRPRESNRVARRRRYAWRGLLTVLALLLVGLLLYALLRPFWHPNSKLVIVEPPAYPAGAAPPLAFGPQQRAGLEALRPALYHQPERDAPLVLDSLENVAGVAALGDQLREIHTGRSDVLMVYVSAHGIAVRGTPYLLCRNVTPSQPLASLVPLRDVLSQMARSPARVKLLILDSGQLAYEPRWGVLTGEFPRLLPQAVEQVGKESTAGGKGRGDDPNLWVLNSNGPFERSHLSRALQRTVFGFFVSEGLRGPADLNGNKQIDVGELHRFVAAQVDGWVRRYTAGNATQTPQLHSTAAARLKANDFPVLLSITAFPEPERSLDLGRALANARATSYTLSYLTGANLPSNEYSLMMRAGDPVMSSRAGRVLLRGYYGSRMLRGAAPAGAPAAPAEGAPAPGSAEGGPEAGPGGAGAEGTPEGADADGGADAGAGAEAARRLRWIRAIGDLLTEGWQLRDQLREDPRPGSIADINPHRLRSFENQWLDLELQFRSGNVGDEQVFAAMLEQRLAVLRQLTGTAEPDALPPDEQELAVWLPLRLQMPAAHSLGLAEAWATRQGESLPEETRKLIDEFDAFLSDGSREDLQQWLAERSEQAARYCELQLARRLLDAPWVSWPVAQQALRARRLAERVASAHPRLIPWCRGRLEQAERLRLRAERELVESPRGASEAYAAQLLREAETLYNEADADMGLVRDALEAEIRLSWRIPYWARWRSLVGGDGGGNAPSHGSLLSLVEALRSVSRALNSPGAEQSLLADLRNSHAQLQQLERRVESATQPEGVGPLLEVPPRPGSSWRIEAMLSTPLPEAPLRGALLTAGEQIDFRLVEGYQLPTTPATPPPAAPPSPEQWSRLHEQARLESGICSLAGDQLPLAESTRAAVERAWERFDQAHQEFANDPLATEKNERLWLETRQLGAAIQEFYALLPDHIRGTTRRYQDLSSLAEREEHVGWLRAAQRALRWLKPQDAERVAGPVPGEVLQRSDYRDQLAWQLTRLRIAEAFALPQERAYWRAAARPYQNPPESLGNQPSLRGDRRPRVDVEAPESISLVSENERFFLLTFRNSSATDVACWVVLQYDAGILDVDDPLQRSLLFHEPPESTGSGFASPRPRPTLVLPAGGSRTLRLRAVRKAVPNRPLRLAVRTIAQPRVRESQAVSMTLPEDARPAATGMFQDGSGPRPQADTLAGELQDDRLYHRRVVDLQLPIPAAIAARLVGPPGTWSPVGSGFVLHSFPNRISDYRLRLANRSGRTKTVDVQLLAPQERKQETLPEGELGYDLADEWLTRLGPTEVLANLTDIELPEDGTPVPLPFGAPADAEAGEGTEAGASSAAPPAPAPSAAANVSGNGQEEKVPGPLVNEGLVLLITDKQIQRKTFVRLAFAPQRPRRFLRAEAAYDMRSEQLRVRVAAREAAWMPPGKIKIRGEFAEPLPANLRVRLEGELQAPDYETTLYADIPAEPRRRVELRVHVDDYPRAFVFRVLCGSQASGIAPEKQLMEIRIVEPEPHTALAAPAAAVPVRAEVDAPEGSFENGNDFVEIGFDEDADREFRDDQPLRFYTDRQVEVRLDALQPDGLLQIDTQVGDFQVDVPGRGLQNVKVNLLGRLFVRKTTAWSVPVPIALDAAPPTIARIKTASGNQAVLGEPLVLSVWAEGSDLSGMAGVEAAFDTARTGEFPEETPPVAGKPAGGGRWEVTLPTDPLTPGQHDVLVRVKDRVGNVGDVQSYPIVAVTPEELAKSQETRVVVTGRVLYRDTPVPTATVALESAEGQEFGPVETDAQGTYRIEDVPIGTYSVSARGVVNNTARFPAEAITLEVKQGDPRVKRLDIPIRPNRRPEEP